MLRARWWVAREVSCISVKLSLGMVDRSKKGRLLETKVRHQEYVHVRICLLSHLISVLTVCGALLPLVACLCPSGYALLT